MENNKVILDLKEYLDLKEFKNKVLQSNVVKIKTSYFNEYCEYITTDNAMLELAEINNKLKNDNDALKIDIRELSTKNIELIHDKELINNMLLSCINKSYWDFRKWRNNYFKFK